MGIMTDYRNRILSLEYIPSGDLTAHPGNWRDHPKAQADALKGVLQEVGIAGALLAYRSARQGGALVVIDGHLRKDAAPQKWPVLILDVDDSEADYLLATHDPLAAMATADAGALDALLSSVNSGEAAVQAMLADTEVYHFWKTRFPNAPQWSRVLASNFVSLPVDSIVFTALAFVLLPPVFGAESMPLAQAITRIASGQILYKAVVTVLSLPLIYTIEDKPIDPNWQLAD